jgi:hypothetical protein
MAGTKLGLSARFPSITSTVFSTNPCPLSFDPTQTPNLMRSGHYNGNVKELARNEKEPFILQLPYAHVRIQRHFWNSIQLIAE